MPARSDIDPADIPALLPYVSIFHEAQGWFRYRLVGTAIAEQIGRIHTPSEQPACAINSKGIGRVLPA
jgi:PAS domain